MSTSTSNKGYSLPTEVLQLILAHCDDPTLYAFMRASRLHLKLGTPILYEHVTISSVKQLERFDDCVRAQSTNSDCPGSTCTVRFTLALHTAAAWSGTSPASMQRTVYRLIDIPQTSLRTGPLFPKLTKAYLYPIRGYSYYTSVSTMEHRASFLSNVRHLHLLGDEKSGPFAIPNCPKLGINLLVDVHLHDYHIAFDPSLNNLGGGFWRFIGDQHNLTTVHVYHESQACLFSEDAQLEEVYITERLVIPPPQAVWGRLMLSICR